MFIFELDEAAAEYENDLHLRARANGEALLEDRAEQQGEEPTYADILAELDLL